MMSQFKNSFVAASPTSQSQGVKSSSSSYANKRPTLAGFVSGGSIGGDIYRTQSTSAYSPAAPVSGLNASGHQTSGETANQKNSER